MTRHSLDISFRDEHICVVNKPAGLAVHKGWAAAEHYALDLLRDQLGQWVYPVHRLDQPTSGALLFALSPAMASVLGQSFREHHVTKRYLALVRGIPPLHLRLDHPVKDEDGERRDAVTVLDRRWVFRKRYALVEARPETGRTHQIRRHLKHLSCPIIGDTSYGKSEHNRLFAREFGLERLALHCLELGFVHPMHGTPMLVTAALPPDLQVPLSRMDCPVDILSPVGTVPGPTEATC